MPYKFYHGRTGRVWNVTPRAIGVVVNKKIGNRLIAKRLHVRLEHVKKCVWLMLRRFNCDACFCTCARAVDGIHAMHRGLVWV